MPQTKRVAVIMQPVRTYCRRIMLGVASVSAQARWECILIPTDAPSPDVHLGGFVHGLIGHFSETDLAERVKRAGLPAVDISPLQGEGHLLPRVSTDDVAVGRLAAAHLLSLGLPHFAFFGTRPHYFSFLREKGFKDAVAAAGLSCHVLLDSAADGSDLPEGAVEAWLRALPKPIGVLASTDSRALQLLAMCRKTGMAVPKSVAVLGVDNDDVFCELASPPLSSIALSTRRIGYEAARMLDRLMAGEKPASGQLLVPPAGVVPRRSSDVPAILDPDVAAAVRYISLHVQDDLQVADVLREVHISRRSLEQRFLKALGRTPAAEIRRAQVEVARQMLAETDEPMARVALAAGFSNAKQLGSGFHHETGVTPTAYRRQSRGG
jgi:LacI family transcriptional regulator, galactose operon repressor